VTNMPTYYVASTELEKTAEVEAPSPRKARTTFLDYLERGDEIDRNQRQMLRETMLTKKVRAGSTGADVSLDYDMRERESREPISSIQTMERFEEDTDMDERTPVRTTTTGLEATTSPAISPPKIHRPELYETSRLARMEPLPRTAAQGQVSSLRPVPREVYASQAGYAPQREATAIMGSPIAQVARATVAPRGWL